MATWRCGMCPSTTIITSSTSFFIAHPVRLIVEEYLTQSRSLDEILEQVERTILAETLTEYRGNQSEVARKLKVPRQTLQRRLKKLGLVK